MDNDIGALIIKLAAGAGLLLSLYKLVNLFLKLSREVTTNSEALKAFVTKLEHQKLQGDYFQLMTKTSDNFAVHEEQLRQLEDASKKSADDRTRLHELLENKLVAYHTQSETSMRELFKEIIEVKMCVVKMEEQLKK